LWISSAGPRTSGLKWATFSPAFCGASSSVFCGGTGDAFFNAFVPAAKAPIGRAYEEGGHAQRHQSLAVGIGADALGGLCQLAELPDALRSGTRLRMCTVHDREPELGRLPLLRKSLPAPTAHTLIETCGCDYVLIDLARYGKDNSAARSWAVSVASLDYVRFFITTRGAA
jgi:hypothetical protein